MATSYTTKFNSTFDSGVTYVDIGTLFCDNSHDQTIDGLRKLADVTIRGNLIVNNIDVYNGGHHANFEDVQCNELVVKGNLTANTTDMSASFADVYIAGIQSCEGIANFGDLNVGGNLTANFGSTTAKSLTLSGSLTANTTGTFAKFDTIEASNEGSFNYVNINGYKSKATSGYAYWTADRNNNPVSGPGSDSPNNYALYISGGGKIFLGGASSLHITSDIRVKQNVVSLDTTDALICMRKLEPVSFEYIDGNKKGIGFIAQTTKRAIPDAVSFNPDFIPNVNCMGTVVKIAEDVSEIRLDHPIDVSGMELPVGLKMTKDTIQSDESTRKTDNTDCGMMEIHDSQCLIIRGNFDNVIDENGRVFVYGTFVHDFHVLDKDVIFTYAVAAVKQLDTEMREMREELAKMKTQLGGIVGK